MSSTILEQAARGIAFPEPLTTDQYHRMIETGVLIEGTPLELIDGLIVRKDRRDSAQDSIMTVGPGHAETLTQIMTLLTQLVANMDCHSRCQQPVHIPPKHEPEPDLSVIRGPVSAYRQRHPEPEEVILLIEVADSSLLYDRETKQRVYASAGIAQYWIVNLNERCVEVYTRPDAAAELKAYSSKQIYGQGETVEFSAAGEVVRIDVDDLFPA